MTYFESCKIIIIKMEGDYIKGTCKTMCSKKEANFRQKQNLLHKFEMKQGTEFNRLPEFNFDKTVKCFSRSAAGTEMTDPSNIRPFPVLMKTVHYLYREIFPLHKKMPLKVYNFMFDRFRAVRQDVVIQNLPPLETIKILEPITKFLIYFGYILIGEDMSEYDPHINNTHLQECMKRLLVCYDEYQCENKTDKWTIESAYLLFNLGNIKSLTRGAKLCKFNSNYSYCLKISLQWYLKNFERVFKMFKNLSPLLLCTATISIPEIRKYALQAMTYAFSSVNSKYPVSQLKILLMYENDYQVVNDCKHFNIKVVDGYVNFLKKDFDCTAKCPQMVRLSWVDEILVDCDLMKVLCFSEK